MSPNKYDDRYPMFIEDIRLNLERVIRFTSDMDFQDFIADDRTICAVERCFQVIGEAVKKIPDGVRQEYSEIPWSEMARFRDKIVHDYDDMDLTLIWSIIEKNVPSLYLQIQLILSKDLKK